MKKYLELGIWWGANVYVNIKMVLERGDFL